MVGNHPVDGHRPRHGNCPRDCDRRIDGNPPSLVIFLWRVNILGIVIFLEMDVKESWPSWDDDDDSPRDGNCTWDGDHPRDGDSLRGVDHYIIFQVMLYYLTQPNIMLVLSTKHLYKQTGTDRQTDRQADKPRYWEACTSKKQSWLTLIGLLDLAWNLRKVLLD